MASSKPLAPRGQPLGPSWRLSAIELLRSDRCPGYPSRQRPWESSRISASEAAGGGWGTVKWFWDFWDEKDHDKGSPWKYGCAPSCSTYRNTICNLWRGFSNAQNRWNPSFLSKTWPKNSDFARGPGAFIPWERLLESWGSTSTLGDAESLWANTGLGPFGTLSTWLSGDLSRWWVVSVSIVVAGQGLLEWSWEFFKRMFRGDRLGGCRFLNPSPRENHLN